LLAELAPDPLRVADDRVHAEVGEVIGLLLGGQVVERADRRRAPRPALVEEQHAVVLERARDPARRGRRPHRTSRFEAAGALEEDEERPLAAVGVCDLAREGGDALAVRPRVVERDRELVLGEDEPGAAIGVRLGHAADHLRTADTTASLPGYGASVG